ncbi:hypothetical protein Tco_0705466 [Tanacetum coccineum]|uniref:DUF4283 domain-containing protein n=1 Tax=Tanacetum coccineum TaxID=301880 RepID=A0ABQ4Y6L8_9ASTR
MGDGDWQEVARKKRRLVFDRLGYSSSNTINVKEGFRPPQANVKKHALAASTSIKRGANSSHSFVNVVKGVLNLEKMGFFGMEIKYVGGLWVLFVFNDKHVRDKFLNHEGIQSWFLSLEPCWTQNFAPEAVETEEEGYVVDGGNVVEEGKGMCSIPSLVISLWFLCMVMAAPVISILSDSSEESVGSHAPRVILFGAIPAVIPVIPVIPAEVPFVLADPLVTPEVGAIFVTLPTGVLDLVDYSSSDSDPSEDSLPPAPELPLVLPFLCSDDSEADSKSEPAKQRPKTHESLTIHDFMVSRWRDMVASSLSSSSGSSSHDTFAPSSEEDIPFGRPYRTHPNEPRKLLTAKKRVGPFLACRLAWRHVSHRSSDHHSSPDFTSDLSFSGSSLNSSSDTSSGSPSDSLLDTSSVHSSGFDASGQTHSRPSTRVASSRSAPLSTPYPPTTSESSPDSSFDRSLDSSLLSARPSSKRCRSPTTSRFILTEDSREEHIKIGTADAEAVADLGIGDGVGAHTENGIGMVVKIAVSDIKENEEEFEAEASARGTVEIEVDLRVRPVVDEDVPDHVTADGAVDITYEILGDLAGQLIASGERASLTDRIRRLGWENQKVRALLSIERDRVDSLRHHMALSQKEFHQIRRDCNDTRRRLRRLESFVERHLGFRP